MELGCSWVVEPLPDQDEESLGLNIQQSESTPKVKNIKLNSIYIYAHIHTHLQTCVYIHILWFRICYIPRDLENSITHWWSQHCSIFVTYISFLQLQFSSWFLFKFLLKFYRLCVKISSVSNVNVIMRHIHELNIRILFIVGCAAKVTWNLSSF